ncbi:MAG: hypothetical protein IJ184_06680 [Alphaproteobacteria bacterium]|nr:hypothetical protein [Alphaproteobacteria bacterium]
MSSRKFKGQSPKLSTAEEEFGPADYVVPELPSELPPPERGEYEGKLKKVEYEEKQGIIINKAEQERLAFNLGRLLRDQLAGLPARLAAKVSAENDARKVKRLIKNECERCARTILGRMADL